MTDPSSPMPLIIRGECLREFACWRRCSMKSNSFMIDASYEVVALFQREREADSQLTPHRFQATLNSLDRGRERETHVTFALRAEDYPRHRRNLGLVQKGLSSLTAVTGDAAHVGESVEGAGRRIASKSQFIQAADEKIATFAISCA